MGYIVVVILRLKRHRSVKKGLGLGLVPSLRESYCLHGSVPLRALLLESRCLFQNLSCELRTLREQLPAILGHLVCVSASTSLPRIMQIGLSESYTRSNRLRSLRCPTLEPFKT